MDTTLWGFTVRDLEGARVPLSRFRGKVCLVVNVTSLCRHAAKQFKFLNSIRSVYRTRSPGFEVLAFPSRQPGGSESVGGMDLLRRIRVQYRAQFPLFTEDEWNSIGASTLSSPVHNFLTSHPILNRPSPAAFSESFAKVLIDVNGRPVRTW